MKNTYVLDGNKIESVDDFYDEVIRKMTDGIEFEPGHNLSALADLIRGGFGKHEYGEPIELIWSNFESSRSMIEDDELLDIIEVITDAEDEERNCIFRIER